jgi:hypothetical protein
MTEICRLVKGEDGLYIPRIERARAVCSDMLVSAVRVCVRGARVGVIVGMVNR